MKCKACDALLADYKQAVKVYANAERSLQGLLEHDYKLAFEKAVKLRQACKAASDAIMEHWRHAHGRASQAVDLS